MSSSTVSFRSFTVFVDTPTGEGSDPKPKATPKPLARSFSDSSILTSAPPIATDKENLDPLTGERVGSSSTLGKKRKGSISVLAVKSLPSETKSSKEKGSEPQPEAKKRKSSISSASSSSKPKAKKGSSSAKKSAKRASRRASPMPKVDEEHELDKEQGKIIQAQIDSKCYDLTVTPLADVSEAYECSGESPVDAFQLVKEPSAEPEFRDYFSSTSSLSSSTSRTLRGSSPAIPKTFSTPERKQIYSAFTFTSPSPTSKRLAKMRSASMPPLAIAEAAHNS
ncbi:hypothetical protein GYMLUDRAFT_77690 [Collybiopsis luxurians FD-317 M1]|uniref:Uncharacterized protein n=1 Tax=Collybiopsis luxurians FD-317 M1 TaxID=944289 RepID=A0A0D0BTK7_9AGAR|nr:hypothetical protein GYMLUDRAFT_77690 [Collybiopsis luxurians FD-317 M1]